MTTIRRGLQPTQTAATRAARRPTVESESRAPAEENAEDAPIDEDARSEYAGLPDASGTALTGAAERDTTRPVARRTLTLRSRTSRPFQMRICVFSIFFSIFYPLMLMAAWTRAIVLRLTKGTPSQILKYGTYPPPKQAADLPPADAENGVGLQSASHRACAHYPCQQLYDQPLDEAKLRAALVGLAAEDGITEAEVLVDFKTDEKPNDWPKTGSYDVTSALVNSYPKGRSYLNDLFEPPFGDAKGWKHKLIVRVWNNDPGKPTVMHFGGSAEGWDGSSNFNFCKELMRRYAGLPPKQVFAKPTVAPDSAKKMDRGSFLFFLAKQPVYLAKSLGGAIWNFTRAAYWAGGNGAFVPRIVSLNLTEDESAKLAESAKKMGTSPFAVFTHAAVAACKDVLHQQPVNIVNQASMQTRHYPVAGQGEERDYVGDWLIGPVTHVPADFDLAAATTAYRKMITDLDELGPMTRKAIWAKAYGLANSGAAAFQLPPTYNDDGHMLDRCLFMNNYGKRTMPTESPFHTWNWNAPLWLGVNTINVNGKTTTLVGSCMWGQDIVEALRDHMEATIRDVISKA